LSEKQQGKLFEKMWEILGSKMIDSGKQNVIEVEKLFNKVLYEAKTGFPRINEYDSFFFAEGDKEAIIWFKKWFGLHNTKLAVNFLLNNSG
jgi:hypothetical protein